MLPVPRAFALALVLSSSLVGAQQATPAPKTAAEAPDRDTSYVDANGTAHVTRVVPVPQTISTEAQKSLSRQESDKVLLNLHGGGFNSDSGSYTESIPIASYSGVKVVAVLYRLSPEAKFPAAVDDSIAVYKELLKTYKPEHIVIYGTSAVRIAPAEVP